MRQVGGRGHHVVVYEYREADGDPFDGLICRPRTRRTTHEANTHIEKVDAEAFLHHLYDHRLIDNLEVSQQAIDEIHQRLKAGRRYAKEG